MTFQDHLERCIADNKETMELLTYRIEGMQKVIKTQKHDNISKLKAAEELTKAKDRVMFHSGCIAAYTDILEQLKQVTKKE